MRAIWRDGPTRAQWGSMKISLRRALTALVLLVVLLGLGPAAFLLDRRLVRGLEDGVRTDLASAPLVLTDRFENQAGARMMHARELASDVELGEAWIDRDMDGVVGRAAALVAAFAGEEPVVIDGEGRTVLGPELPIELVDATRAGEMPVEAVATADGPVTVALAPLKVDGAWAGTVGVWVPMGQEEADRLSALTRSDVLLEAPDGSLAAYTGRAEPAMGLFDRLAELPVSGDVREMEVGGERYLVVSGALPGGLRATFVRSLAEELAVVPALRRNALVALAVALAIALVVGGWFASRLARPVGALAVAADRIRDGDFEAPAPASGIAEVDRVGQAFGVMRDALARRIDELAAANRELEDRQERLAVLQAELVQRDRLSAASRLLAQLAHEVRNPVASVRNCLEVLRRRVRDDDEASELADLAIDELLRMHELAERMLDLHRPGSTAGECDAAAVAGEVAALVRVGIAVGGPRVRTRGPDELPAAIPADPLKQVLLNLVQNAQDALGPDTEGTIEIRVERVDSSVRIDVLDTGPGIADEVLPQVFDPFFTTKADVRGVGLGLFTAAGIVRAHGGRIAASNRADGGGARFTVEVPVADEVVREVSA